VRRRAFSLIELVVVLSIVGVMAAVAIPRYGRAISRTRVEQAADRVVHDLHLAADRARALSQPYHAVFSTTKDYYRLAEGVATKAGILDRQSVVYLGRDPYLVNILQVNFGGSVGVTFDAFGTPDAHGQISLRAGNVVRFVTLDANSRATVSIPAFMPIPDPKPDPITPN
jgi:prepilin-type N-terminal cleavage/methylation domain-containing protein